VNDWIRGWNWGDVPGWLGVAIAILVPSLAYLSRNRIAGFVRRKVQEPKVALAPLRWLIRPTTTKGYWALVNTSASTAYNVSIHPLEDGAEVVDAGFWPIFMPRSAGTVVLHGTPTMTSVGLATDFKLSWQDADSTERSQTLEVPAWRESWKGLPVSPQLDGKVVPMSDISSAPSDT